MVAGRGPPPIGRLTYEYEPSELNVHRARMFSQPLIVVPVFLVLFFALVFGASYFFEGKEELGIAILVSAAVGIGLLLAVGKPINRA